MTCRNEQIRHLAGIFLPRFAVLRPASLYVPHGAVGDHDDEENGVEPWEGGVEAGDEGPREREVDVARVVYLAGVCV